MLTRAIAFTAASLAAISLHAVQTDAQQSGTTATKQCLHGPGETADQSARRRDALTATRTINNIQSNRPEARDQSYLRQDQLAASPFAMRMKSRRARS